MVRGSVSGLVTPAECVALGDWRVSASAIRGDLAPSVPPPTARPGDHASPPTGATRPLLDAGDSVDLRLDPSA